MGVSPGPPGNMTCHQQLVSLTHGSWKFILCSAQLTLRSRHSGNGLGAFSKPEAASAHPKHSYVVQGWPLCQGSENQKVTLLDQQEEGAHTFRMSGLQASPLGDFSSNAFPPLVSQLRKPRSLLKTQGRDIVTRSESFLALMFHSCCF